MMIIMRNDATEQDVQHLVDKVKAQGVDVHVSKGAFATVIGLVGDTAKAREMPLATFPGVERVVPILKPFKLVGREFHPSDTIVDVRGVKIGGSNFTVIAGPCSVEDRESFLNIARFVHKAGAQIMRGGAFKPRSSPYSFQGLGEEGLKIMAEAREETGMPICTEVMDARDVDLVIEYADILQIGARNMQNFTLLKYVGQTKKPVMIKRGLASTIEEFLMAAEYVMSGGNTNVILCERGIRTFETYTRNTLDLSCVPLCQKLSHLPIITDPSHGVGRWDIVEPMSIASVAVGAHGIMIEVHPNPEEAFSDGYESLKFDNFETMMKNVKQVVRVFGRGM
jgi:3-deoxy-7-phosphoheptulonate synthase